jgi:glycosyltransferase involved in cell wall biosynthesis
MQIALNTKFNEIASHPDRFIKESKWIAPKDSSVTGYKYMCYMGASGYSDAAKNYIRSLVEQGVYVALESIHYHNEKTAPLLTDDDNVLAVCLNNNHIQYHTVIMHSTPTEWRRIVPKERAKNPNVKIYGLTVWETDRVFGPWMQVIDNVQLDGLIVPSEWNRQIFELTAQKEGIASFPPISACHHMLTDAPASAVPISRESLYGSGIRLAFLCIGTWGPRKGIMEAINAYLTAFAGRTDVSLYVKTSLGRFNDPNNEKIRQSIVKVVNQQRNPPKIIIDVTLRTDDYINDLMTHCDAFLSLCNSEGVGLGACCSALKGKIVVMTGYGGQSEYIQKGEWIDYKLGHVDVPNDFVEWIRPPQKWAYPSQDDAIAKLKAIDAGLDAHKQASLANRQFILDRFSPNVIGQRLLSIVNQPKRVQTIRPVQVGFKSNDKNKSKDKAKSKDKGKDKDKKKGKGKDKSKSKSKDKSKSKSTNKSKSKKKSKSKSKKK